MTNFPCICGHIKKVHFGSNHNKFDWDAHCRVCYALWIQKRKIGILWKGLDLQDICNHEFKLDNLRYLEQLSENR